MSLTVLVPTRGRPTECWQVQGSFEATRSLPTTRLVFIVDEDDPRLAEYVETHAGQRLLVMRPDHAGGMVNALNAGVAELLERWPQEEVIGFIGDDHRFRSDGWDRLFLDRLREQPGVAYGNDLFWPAGEIPTQAFISSVIVRALGWFGLPTCKHLFIDNAWRVIGEGIGSFHYFPEVIIEHLHPASGKVAWSEGHQRVNAPAVWEHDRAAFESWLRDGAADDVERVQAALRGDG